MNQRSKKSSKNARKRQEKPDTSPATLAESVSVHLQRYFDELKGEVPTNLFALVTAEVERPLLESVMHYTGQNQSEAARILGINRNTLRSKLQTYQLI